MVEQGYRLWADRRASDTLCGPVTILWWGSQVGIDHGAQLGMERGAWKAFQGEYEHASWLTLS